MAYSEGQRRRSRTRAAALNGDALSTTLCHVDRRAKRLLRRPGLHDLDRAFGHLANDLEHSRLHVEASSFASQRQSKPYPPFAPQWARRGCYVAWAAKWALTPTNIAMASTAITRAIQPKPLMRLRFKGASWPTSFPVCMVGQRLAGQSFPASLPPRHESPLGRAGRGGKTNRPASGPRTLTA